jgi:hypothetical protein
MLKLYWSSGPKQQSVVIAMCHDGTNSIIPTHHSNIINTVIPEKVLFAARWPLHEEAGGASGVCQEFARGALRFVVTMTARRNNAEIVSAERVPCRASYVVVCSCHKLHSACSGKAGSGHCVLAWLMHAGHKREHWHG